jgi:Cu/Ag efflux protein CusF
MKRTLLVLLVLLISAAFVTTVFAQTPAKQAPATEKAPAVHKLAGEVLAVDAAAKTLSVKGSKAEVKFDVASAKWAGYKAMDEVKAGDKVSVKYVEKDGKMVATHIAKVVPKTTKKAK